MKKRVVLVHMSVWPTVYRVECGEDGQKRAGDWNKVTCKRCLKNRRPAVSGKP